MNATDLLNKDGGGKQQGQLQTINVSMEILNINTNNAVALPASSEIL